VKLWENSAYVNNLLRAIIPERRKWATKCRYNSLIIRDRLKGITGGFMNQPFLLGVNYWPRRKGMYWWSDFDDGEVCEEFSIIHELGLSLVRIFLLWDDFQPTANEISANSLNNLVTVCEIASSLNLKLDVTFFTGHMSGSNWAPRWMLYGEKPQYLRQVVSAGKIVESGYLNPYSDDRVLRAENLQLRTVVNRLKDHPAIWCWNLGNEPDLFAWPSSDHVGEKWASEMVETIHSIDSGHPVTCGLHVASLLYNNGLRLDQIFSKTDIAVMHSYPMYMLGLARNPLDTDYVPFTCALTAALSGKPVLMEEFGGCTAPPGRESFDWEWIGYGQESKQFMASEESLAEYYAEVLPKLIDVGVIGALAWCFADYHPDLWDRPPCSESWHERYFGLVRPDGSLKPHAKTLSDFAATNPMQKPATKVINLPYTSSEYYDNTLEKLLTLYQQWVGAI
jgi:endo-1,4-beta-mannosidase